MATWTLDSLHSSIQFKAKHMVITTVTGSFLEFSGQVQTQGDSFEDAQISFEAKVASVDTGVQDRDDHLRSPDFFDVEKYPTITFQSTSFKKNENDTNYVLRGNLTIKGITKPVELNVEYGGQARDLYGQMKAGFEMRGKINRRDFGLVWSGVTEEGTALVSDDIYLLGELQIGKNE